MSIEELRKDIDYVRTTALDDEEVMERILRDLRRGRAAKADAFTRNERYERIYRALDQPEMMIDSNTEQILEDRAIYSNTYLALGAAIVDTATVQVYNRIFSTPDYFRMSSDDWWDQFYSGRITAHMKRRHKEMKFKLTLLQILQQCFCFDYAVSIMGWRYHGGNVPKRKTTQRMETIGGIAFPYQDTKIVNEWVPNAVDRPELQVIDFFNCIPDPSAGSRGIEDSTFFIDWWYEPIANLLDGVDDEDHPFGRYKNINKVIERHHDLTSGITELDNSKLSEAQKDLLLQRLNRMLIIRYHTQDEVIESAHGIVIHRRKIDGMKIRLWKAYELPNQLPGMGVLQRIERNQYDINAIINFKRDFQNLTIHPITAISRDAIGLEDGDMAVYPGKNFRTRGKAGDALHFYQPGHDISQGASEELNVETEFMERVSGFGGENVQGAFASGRKTAREVNAVMSGILSKVNVITEKLESGALIDTYAHQFLLEQTYFKESQRIRVEGPRGDSYLVIRPEDYAWGKMPEFEALGSGHAADQEMREMALFKGINVAQGFPQFHNWPNLLASMWQTLAPKDWTQFIKDPRDKEHNTPPSMENVMMAHGHHVEVSALNRHGEHIKEHEALKQTPDYRTWPESFKLKHEQHIQAHRDMQTAVQLPRMSPTGGQDSSDMMRGNRM